MSKATKIWLIIATSLVVLGIIIFAGIEKNFAKINKELLITCFMSRLTKLLIFYF